MTHRYPHVTIAVLTYRRTEELAALLPVLLEQAGRCGLPASVLVVDNDPDASGSGIVSAFDSHVVQYVHEPTPGIAAARNRALDEAASDLLVFIDDDERPVERWLELMIETWQIDRPVGVVGPVISEFSAQPDPWILGGGFFTRKRRPTGSIVTVAATNNLLLDLAGVRRLNLRFDPDFGLSGGSDTLFTRELAASGARLVWCDEAIVHDLVPASRLTREWVLQRYYRSGNSWSRTSLKLAGSGFERMIVRLRLTWSGGVRVLGGVGGSSWGAIVRSISMHARGSKTLHRGMGMVSGAWGHVYSEYRRA